MYNKKDLIDLVENKKQVAFDIADYIWKNPELSLQEYLASDKLCEALEGNGFNVEKGMSGMPTAFIATWGEGKPVVAFSSEYDALPNLSQKKDAIVNEQVVPGGPGHGCGHNLLACCGVLAAIALKDYMTENKISGTIKIFGTPAEEICVGKPFMARDGLFEGVDAFIDWHPSFVTKSAPGSTNAYFNIKYHFHGKTSQGALPWNGKSSLDSALLMGHAIEMLREHIKPGDEASPTTLNYAFPDVGNMFPNVVPKESVVWCVGRMKTAEMAADVIQRLQNAAEGCALATGTTVTTEFTTATHELIPNLRLGYMTEENMKIVGIPNYSAEDKEIACALQKEMNAEVTGYPMEIEETKMTGQPVTDSSEYSWHAPIAFFNIALTPSVETGWHSWTVAKCAGSEVAHRVVETASKVLALNGLDILTKPEILKEANEEFAKRINGRKYETLLPKEIMPDLNTYKEDMDKFHEIYKTMNA